MIHDKIHDPMSSFDMSVFRDGTPRIQDGSSLCKLFLYSRSYNLPLFMIPFNLSVYLISYLSTFKLFTQVSSGPTLPHTRS